MNTYGYVDQNPINFIDPYGLDGVNIHFDGYPITIPNTNQTVPAGHAGVVAIDPNTGSTRYYEYGRYESDFGNVQNKPVPDVAIGDDGKPTQKSLENLYNHLLNNVGKGYPVDPTYYSDANYQDIVDFAENRMNDPNRAPYSWYPWESNHCKDFAEDAISSARPKSDRRGRRR